MIISLPKTRLGINSRAASPVPNKKGILTRKVQFASADGRWQPVFRRGQGTDPARVVGTGRVVRIVKVDHQLAFFPTQVGQLDRIQ